MCRWKEGVGRFPERNKVLQQSDVSMQGQFSFPFSRLHHLSPQRLLFSWGPGSLGEQLAEGAGIKVERGHYLLLQVLIQKVKTGANTETLTVIGAGAIQPRDWVPHRQQWTLPKIPQKS